jgi:hypothetical protein
MFKDSQVHGVHGTAVKDARRHGLVFDKAAQPLEVARVHYARHVARVGEEPLQRRLEHLELQGKQNKPTSNATATHLMVDAEIKRAQGIDHQDRKESLLDEHVVDGEARLSGAGRPLGPDDAVHRDLQLPRAVHHVEDAGALAAQFQRHGRQVPGRCGHHGAPDARAAREQDLVPPVVLHEPLPDLRAALDHLHRCGVHVPPDVLGEEPGGARRELRRLQRHRVPGRDGPDQRLQRQTCETWLSTYIA